MEWTFCPKIEVKGGNSEKKSSVLIRSVACTQGRRIVSDVVASIANRKENLKELD